MSVEVFTIDELKARFGISDEAIQSCGFSEEELKQIYDDYSSNRIDELEKYKNEFLSKYIIAAKGIKFHSYGGRVKDSYHLIEKIVRKRHNNNKKYAAMRTDDYYKYITDLIGCRILLVYKDDWRKIHTYIVNTFGNSSEKYIDENNYAGSYAVKVSKPFIAEKPTAFIRLGDYDDIYNEVSDIQIKRDGYYRSVHYVIRLDKYYLELQVRSLFDEAWGEVDHDVLYPYYKEYLPYVRFSEIISRISGTGDELGAYFKKYVSIESSPEVHSLKDTPILPSSYIVRKEEYQKDRMNTEVPDNSTEESQMESTAGNELNKILKE